jgi:predicted dinucleotide-binding enzyme
MSESDGTVAIIGTGNIGGTLAAEFAAGGQGFLLAAAIRRPRARSRPALAGSPRR